MVNHTFRAGVMMAGLAALVGCSSSEPLPTHLDISGVGRVNGIRYHDSHCNNEKVYQVYIEPAFNKPPEQQNILPSGQNIALCYNSAPFDLRAGERYYFDGFMRTTHSSVITGNTILPVVVAPFDQDSQRAPPLYDMRLVTKIVNGYPN